MAYKPQQLPHFAEQTVPAISSKKWLIIFCLFQLVFWTLGPLMVRFNPVYDTMESFVWGNQWQWGYDKHPPFTAWLTALFGNITPTPDLGIYLLAQLSVVVTFLAVWRLAREYLNDRSSVLAVLMLTGVLHYSNLVERVTPDTMQSPIWALLGLSFYFAVLKQSLRYWLMTGFLTGLAVLTKYQVVVLLAPMILALLLSDKAIPTLRSAGPWLAVLVALAVISPHLIWLYDNNFPAFRYLDDQYVSGLPMEQKSWAMHLKAPLDFALNCLGNVVLILFVCWPLFKSPKYYYDYSEFQSSFKRYYLITLGLGPTLTSLIFGAINAHEMVPRWSTPYYAWLPLLILVILNRDVTGKIFKNIVIRCFVLAITLWVLRIGYLYYKPYTSDDYWRADEFTPALESMRKAESLWVLRIGYLYYKPYTSDDYWRADEFTPALESMRKAESLWQQHFKTPLPYLGGGHYHVMAMSAYSIDKTIPFSNLNPANSLWIEESDFRKKGGELLLWRKI